MGKSRTFGRLARGSTVLTVVLVPCTAGSAPRLQPSSASSSAPAPQPTFEQQVSSDPAVVDLRYLAGLHLFGRERSSPRLLIGVIPAGLARACGWGMRRGHNVEACCCLTQTGQNGHPSTRIGTRSTSVGTVSQVNHP